MMRSLAPSLFCLCLCAAQASAQKLELPPEIKGLPGQFILVQPKTDCKKVKYLALDSGLNTFPSGMLADPVATVVVAIQPGKYRLLAYGAKGDEPTEPVVVSLVVGNPGPAPVPPTPVPPGPTPPNPVPPPDPTPGPDALAQALAGIYGGLQEANKAQVVAVLARVYRQAAADAGKYGTLGEYYFSIRRGSSGQVPDTACQPLREKISEHLASVLGTDPTTRMDSNLVARAQVEFTRLATILEGFR